jgi:hypothetical protein
MDPISGLNVVAKINSGPAGNQKPTFQSILCHSTD